jgi:hypothetical protein
MDFVTLLESSMVVQRTTQTFSDIAADECVLKRMQRNTPAPPYRWDFFVEAVADHHAHELVC